MHPRKGARYTSVVAKRHASVAEARGLAQRVYESTARERLFDEAYEMFPEYNEGGSDTDMAMDHIVDGLLRSANVHETQFTAAAWDAFINDLSEMVYAGLT